MVASPIELMLMILPAHVDSSVGVGKQGYRSHQLLVYHRVIYPLFTLQNGLALSINGGRHVDFRKSKIKVNLNASVFPGSPWIFSSNLSRCLSLGRSRREGMSISSGPFLLTNPLGSRRRLASSNNLIFGLMSFQLPQQSITYWWLFQTWKRENINNPHELTK